MMRHHWLHWMATFLVVCFAGSGVVHGADDRAFPGAEGFGANVKGGRGGEVIWVTNLDSHGPGSLREAVNTPGPRIIEFKVAGTIELGRDILRVGFPFRPTWKKLLQASEKEEEMKNPYSFLTIDGASGPGGGITISGNLSLGPYALEQVIVRNLRIRDNGFTPRSSADCIGVYARHVLIDHCSLQWARDEVASVWYGNGHDVTIQWCIIGPGWGTHALGFLNGYGTDRITLHHCLFANNIGRNPRICGNSRRGHLGKFPNDTPIIDCRNNVFYNWFNVGAAQIASGAHCNMVGNLYLPGRDSSKQGVTILAYCSSRTKPTVLYLKGNICPKRPTDDMDEWAGAGRYVSEGGRNIPTFGPYEWGQKRATPFPAPPVITHSAEDAKTLVLSQAGAWPRDPVDAGVVRTVLRNTGFVGVKNTLPSDFTNARPSARATATLAKAGKPLTVSFRGSGEDTDGEVSIYTWDFGDGQRAIGSKGKHTYAAPGEYVATLFAVDDRGMSQTASLKIIVGKDGFKVELVSPAPAVTPTPPPAPQTWTPPTVNIAARLAGPPTEEDWASAQRLAPFINQATWKKSPDGQVDAKLLYDSENLYLRITCNDIAPSLIKNVKASEAFISPTRHGLEYVSSLKITAFISPKHGQTPWYRFTIGLRGLCYDAKGPDRTWNSSPDWRIMSKAIEQKWQMTAAFPLRALDAAPGKDQVWGLKLMINTGKDVIHIWPPVGSAGKDLYCVPHTSDPVYYARLQFP